MPTTDFRALPEALVPLVERLNAAPGRWRPNRLMLRNYWLIGRQDFTFVQGRMNLRGNNGLGKSTLLIPCITLALDGDKRRRRMDSFGSEVKSIEDYLIGPPRAPVGHPLRHEERTGYVALEFRKGGSDQYVTIGLGLHASRASDRGADSWYFVLTDGRRVGSGFELHRGSDPLDRKELEVAIGGGGRVTTTLREYQGWVNDLLFRFKNPNDLRNLTDILVKLRTPKLSNDLLPSRTAGHLSEALPSLDADTLETISKNLQEINTFRSQVKELRLFANAVAQIHQAQGQMVWHLAQEAAAEFLLAKGAYDRQLRDLIAMEGDLTRNRGQEIEAGLQLQRAEKRSEEAKRALGVLEADETMADERRLAKLRHDLAALEQELGRHAGTLRDEQERHRRMTREEEASRGEWPEVVHRASEALRELRRLTEPFQWEVPPIDFDRLTAVLDHGGVDGATEFTPLLRRNTAQEALASRAVLLRRVLAQTREVDALRGRYQAARERRGEALANHDRDVESSRSAQAELGRARQSCRATVELWRRDCSVLEVDDAAADEVLAGIDAYGSPDKDVFALLQPVRSVRSRIHGEIAEAQGRVRAEIGELERGVQLAERAIEALRTTEPIPDPRPGQAEARVRLRAAGIDSVPLFAAVDLREAGTDEEAARGLEAALEEAGLLDALVIDPARIADAEGLLDEHAGDRWIRPLAVDGPTLAQVLTPAPGGLNPAIVHAALASVGLGTGSEAPVFVAVDGRWQAGALQGRAATAGRDRVRFIGATNRALERDRQITALQYERDALIARTDEASARVRRLAAELARLAEEEQSLAGSPVFPELRRRAGGAATAAAAAERSRADLERCDRAVLAAERARDTGEEQLDRAVASVPEAQGRTVAGLEELIQHLADARVAIESLHGRLEKMEARQDQIRGLQRDLGDQLRRVEEAVRTRDASSVRLVGQKAEIQEIERRLDAQADDVRQMRERRDELRLRIDEEARNLRHWEAEERSASAQVKHFERRIEPEQQKFAEAQAEFHSRSTELSKRLRAYETLARELALAEQDSVESAARELLSRRTGSPREMRERVRADVVASRNALDAARLGEEARAIPHPLEVRDGLCFFRVRNAEFSPHRLLVDLQADIATREDTITQKDNELFSGFLLHTVADQIRGLIAGARAEVGRINEVLEKHRLSHDRYLSLEWKPVRSDRSGSKEKPVSPATLDLARLMATPYDLQTGPNQERFRRLLRARLDEAEREGARRVPGRTGGGAKEASFDARLEAALDYRSWFEFRIYLNEGDMQMELDDQEFKRNSGGEKSLNMFIPLLAAVGVRYMAAGDPDAPRMIGLDEAFAGVDTDKTYEMLRLLSEFDFSWVMTSEKLWGMAPGLRGCATYNLFMEGNKILPIPYIWDGQRLHSGIDTAQSLGVSAPAPLPSMPGV